MILLQHGSMDVPIKMSMDIVFKRYGSHMEPKVDLFLTCFESP